MTVPSNPPGFYGKLPVLADFVSRRLPNGFIQPWDNWLQGALSASRDQLGPEWLDDYLVSPIWRFVLNPGNCGAEAWAGVLMPSVDRVGRYFPLTLAVSIGDPKRFHHLFITAADWFDRLEQLALSALEDGFDLDRFDRELQELVLALPAREKEIHRIENRRMENNPRTGFRLEMGKLEQMQDAFIHLSALLLDRFLPACSLWSTTGSKRIEPCMLIYGGLPPIGAYSEMLNGQWLQGGLRIHPDASFFKISPDAPSPAESCQKERDMNRNRICWRSSALTTVGKRRQINEDAYLERPDIGLWAVADGMGGHRAGDVASKAIVHALSKLQPSDSLKTFTADLTECLQKVNAQLIAMADNDAPEQIIGSTIVAMLAVENRCAGVWAGDSRIYRLRNDVLTQLTRDHSLAAEMSPQGTGAFEPSVTLLESNIITRALGVQPDISLETVTYEAEADDIYLLCSDGLDKEVRPQELAGILKQNPCEKSSKELIDLALERGARDNVTVIVIHACRPLLM